MNALALLYALFNQLIHFPRHLHHTTASATFVGFLFLLSLVSFTSPEAGNGSHDLLLALPKTCCVSVSDLEIIPHLLPEDGQQTHNPSQAASVLD